MNPNEMTAQQLAQSCSDVMHGKDRAAQLLGMEIIESTPGKAVVQMRVRDDMVNGLDICHGGLVFTLCDTAFAHACNNTNNNTVASGCTIDFLAPSYTNDLLTASAKERFRGGRSGVYDVNVINQHNTLLAVFRGKAAQIRGHLIEEKINDDTS